MKNLFSYVKMGKEILRFCGIEIEKKKKFRNETPILLKYVGIEKVLGSHKIYFGKNNYKYFIGYLHNGDKYNAS